MRIERPKSEIPLLDEVDFETRETIEKPQPLWIKAFSLNINLNRLITVSPNNLTYLDSIRFLSMAWVIYGHSIAFMSMFNVVPCRDIDLFMDNIKKASWQLFTGAEFAVDSFFVLSGFLMAYFTIQAYERTNAWKVVLISYLSRFARLLPTIAFITFFYWWVAPHIPSGPMQYLFGHMTQETCKDGKWAATLFGFMNFWPEWGETCEGWLWYIANDIQLAFFTIPILILFRKKMKKNYKIIGWSILILIIIAQLITTGILINHYDVSVNILKQPNDYFDKIYQRPYTRSSPYIFGIIIALLPKKKFKSWWKSYLILLFCMGIMAMLIFWPVDTYKTDEGWNTSQNVSYMMFHRPVWGLLLSIIIYLILSDNLNLLKLILSFKFIVPLSRLTFVAYLLHPIIQFITYESFDHAVSYSPVFLCIAYFGFMILSYGFGLLLNLLVESPFAVLYKSGVLKR